MRQPTRLPHGVFGVMSENLHAPFGHLTCFDARNRKCGFRFPRFGVNRPPQLHDWAGAKSVRLQALAFLTPIRDRERNQMNARKAHQRAIQFLCQRRIGSLEQHFDVAAGHHCGGVAGAGQFPTIALNRDRRWRESGARQRAACSIAIGNKMRHMIKEDFPASR